MILKRRTRLVYCRLSEDEYETFENTCRAQGARSISDMMRNALRKLSEPEPVAVAGAAQRLYALDQLLSEFFGSLDQLEGILKGHIQMLQDYRQALSKQRDGSELD